MKTLCLICSLFITSISILAQKKTDMVFLLDGSIYKGNIIEENAEKLRIESSCGNVYAVKFSEIERIIKDSLMAAKTTIKQKGYMNFNTLGVMVGSSSDAHSAPLSILMEHNYRFNKWFAAGGLMGFEMLNENVIPLAAQLKFFKPTTDGSIFTSVSGGWSYSLEAPEEYDIRSSSGGILFSAEFGWMVPLGANTSFLISAGYRYNELNYERIDPWYGNTDRAISFNRIVLRIGVAFY